MPVVRIAVTGSAMTFFCCSSVSGVRLNDGLMLSEHTSTTTGASATTGSIWLLLVKWPALVGRAANIVTEVCSSVFGSITASLNTGDPGTGPRTLLTVGEASSVGRTSGGCL